MGATNGLLGMAVAALGTLLLLKLCASETKEKVDQALAQEIIDSKNQSS